MDKIIRKHRLKYLTTVILSIFSALLMAIFAMRMGDVIDLVAKQDTTLFQKILSAIAIIGIWFVISLLFSFMKSKYVSDIIKDLKKEIYISLYDKELYEYVSKTNEYYLNIFTKNMDFISDSYLSPRVEIVSNAISPIISVGVIFFIDWRLGFSFVGVSVLTIVLSQLPGVLMKKKTANFSKKSAEYLKVLNTHLKGFEQVKLLGVSDLFLKGYRHSDEKFENSRKEYLFTLRAVNNLGIFFSFIAQLLCVSIGIWFVLKGEISIGLLIASINILNGVFNPIQSFVHNKNLLGSVTTIKEEVESLLVKKEAHDTALDRPIESIFIEDLSLNFSNEKTIFERLNINFEMGKKYAIVGESGRGKSTLVKLIMKYYNSEQYSGKIRINDCDVNEIASKSLYEKIAYVQRNDFFVDGTVRDNIVLNRPLSEKQHELYERLNFNKTFLNKPIELGSRNHVSSGEKQRVDIARFLVRDYDAMIFDEPTSNLDLLTRNMIFDLIFALKDKLVIVITHEDDPQILGHFDEVIRI